MRILLLALSVSIVCTGLTDRVTGPALGAEKRKIFQMVIGQGLRLAVSGLIIGAVAALFLTRLLSSFSQLLYGVGASDPVTFAAVSLTLAGAAILGCYVPARRALIQWSH